MRHGSFWAPFYTEVSLPGLRRSLHGALLLHMQHPDRATGGKGRCMLVLLSSVLHRVRCQGLSAYSVTVARTYVCMYAVPTTRTDRTADRPKRVLLRGVFAPNSFFLYPAALFFSSYEAAKHALDPKSPFSHMAAASVAETVSRVAMLLLLSPVLRRAEAEVSHLFDRLS